MAASGITHTSGAGASHSLELDASFKLGVLDENPLSCILECLPPKQMAQIAPTSRTFQKAYFLAAGRHLESNPRAYNNSKVSLVHFMHIIKSNSLLKKLRIPFHLRALIRYTHLEEIATHCTPLQEISGLDRCTKITLDDFLAFVELAGKHLINLQIPWHLNRFITNAHLIRFADSCPNLTNCPSLDGCNIITHVGFLEFLERKRIGKNFTNVHIPWDLKRFITNAHLIRFADSCPNLTNCPNLDDCDITLDDFLVFLERMGENFTNVHIPKHLRRFITNAHLIRFAALCPNLTDCPNLDDCNITLDDFLAFLLHIGEHFRIVHIPNHLRRFITNAHLIRFADLCPLMDCPNLDGCNITEFGFLEFLKRIGKNIRLLFIPKELTFIKNHYADQVKSLCPKARIF